MTISERHDVYYDPFDVSINADPYPTFQRLRERVAPRESRAKAPAGTD